MALTKGLNSYVTVAEATGYFENRLDVAAWTDAADAQKAQALVTATSLLDAITWIGRTASLSQTLAFPRTAAEYYDPFVGDTVALDSNEVPKRILTACYELAYHLLNNDGLLDDTGGVSAINVAGISIDKPQNANKIPTHVRTLISPLKENASSRAWWRSN